MIGERLGEDRDARLIESFVRSEIAAAKDRDLKDLEEFRRDAIISPDAARQRKGGIERDLRSGGNRLDSGFRLEAGQNTRARFFLEFDFDGVTGIQAVIDGVNSIGSAQKDTGANQQKGAAGDLDDDQRIAQSRRAIFVGEIAASGLNHARPRGLQRGSQTKENGCDERGGHHECEDPEIRRKRNNAQILREFGGKRGE